MSKVYASEVVKIATAEDGYLEKKSDAYLDDKTKNAGNKNYTKYARDMNEKGKGTKLDYSEDMVLEDNYMRDENGEVKYWQYAGGGTFDTAHYKVRLLYYNYYY